MIVSLSEVVIDLDVQLKARRVDQETVAAYVDALTNGATFPPVILFRQDGLLWLADGFHRVAAARFMGATEIEAEIVEGGKEAATLYAATANVAHGKPMSADEKREAGERLIQMKPLWSNSEIARRLAVRDTTILRWRQGLKKKNAPKENSANAENESTRQWNGQEREGGTESEPASLLDKEAAEPALVTASTWPTGLIALHLVDFRQAEIEPGSVDVILTDPPYAREYLPLYADLARCAACWLKEGGTILCMTGQSYLPDILPMMAAHLEYRWTLCYLTPGGQSPQIFPCRVNTFWKPVLCFGRGQYAGYWVGDVVKSAVNDNDKRFHEWGQSESGMAELVEKFSQPGDIILDPMMGAGTTGVVALRLQRRFIGIDLDAEAVQAATARITGWMA